MSAPSPRDYAASYRSKDAFGVRVEAHFTDDERELQMHVVLALDGDVAAVALDGDLACGLGQVQRVGGIAQMLHDLRVGVVGGETCLLPHGVLILVEVEVLLTDAHAEIDHHGEDEQREQTANRAESAPPNHHCDFAPSTMSLTMRLIASRRPPASSRSA